MTLIWALAYLAVGAATGFVHLARWYRKNPLGVRHTVGQRSAWRSGQHIARVEVGLFMLFWPLLFPVLLIVGVARLFDSGARKAGGV